MDEKQRSRLDIFCSKWGGMRDTSLIIVVVLCVCVFLLFFLVVFAFVLLLLCFLLLLRGVLAVLSKILGHGKQVFWLLTMAARRCPVVCVCVCCLGSAIAYF